MHCDEEDICREATLLIWQHQQPPDTNYLASHPTRLISPSLNSQQCNCDQVIVRQNHLRSRLYVPSQIAREFLWKILQWKCSGVPREEGNLGVIGAISEIYNIPAEVLLPTSNQPDLVFPYISILSLNGRNSEKKRFLSVSP